MDDEETLLRKMRRLTDYYDIHKEIGRYSKLFVNPQWNLCTWTSLHVSVLNSPLIIPKMWSKIDIISPSVFFSFLFYLEVRFPMWNVWPRRGAWWSTLQSLSPPGPRTRSLLWERWTCFPGWTMKESFTFMMPLRRRTQSSSSQSCILEKQLKPSTWCRLRILVLGNLLKKKEKQKNYLKYPWVHIEFEWAIN